MKKLLALITTLFLTGCVPAKTIQVKYTWTPPTYGSSVEKYIVEHRTNTTNWHTIGTTNTNVYVVACKSNTNNYVRVCGVDSGNNVGVWSVSSDAYKP
jgi:ribulose bisphosphate carboxylase small subunit